MFVLMVYFMPVTLNNFLIAKVSAVYEIFQETATLTMNANKIALIKDYLMFQEALGKNKDFNIMIMFQSEEKGGDEPWAGVSKEIQATLTEKMDELKTLFASKEEMTTVTTNQEEMKTEIAEVKKEIANVSENISKILAKLNE